jgi:hypothetical protein
MWNCKNCGKTFNERPEDMKCPSCGITLGRTKATRQKLRILKEICELNNYALLIDACAGSGKVQLLNGEIIDGSSGMLQEVANKKKPPAKLICIEHDPKTFRLLRWRTGWSPEPEFINDDCNNHLPKFTDGKVRTLVFIDPFGYGLPAIRRDVVLKLSSTPNTDLLINFTWRIAREMGYARKYLSCTISSCPSPSRAGEKFGSCDLCSNRRTAISYTDSANIWWGNEEWLNWGSLKRIEYAKRYASPLKDHNKVEIYCVPEGYEDPTYQLILATKFELLKYGIEKWFE